MKPIYTSLPYNYCPVPPSTTFSSTLHVVLFDNSRVHLVLSVCTFGVAAHAGTWLVSHGQYPWME